MLRTARAIVVDDHYVQVEPAIKALARLGIGSVYLTGKVEDLPEQRLKGIRLAVVDMDLGNGAEGQSDAETADQTLNYLKAALDEEDSSPLMVVVWTGSDGVYQEFRTRLTQVLTHISPAVICRLDKGKFNLDSQAGVEDAADEFKTLIQAELDKVRPLDVLWAWEQAVHDAASRTTSTLADVIRTPGLKPGKWPAAASNLLAAIARAAAGKHQTDARGLLDDLLGSFEPLLQDRIEHHRISEYAPLEASAELLKKRVGEQAEHVIKLGEHKAALARQDAFKKAFADVKWEEVKIVADSAGTAVEPNAGRRRSKVLALVKTPERPSAPVVTPDQAARVNGMLQWSILPADQTGVRPGNIYLLGDKGSGGFGAFTRTGMEPADLLKSTLFKSDLTGEPVFVEATPACDYAQGKWMMPRFVLGCLVTPEVAATLPANADFLRIYGSAWQSIPGRPAGPASLVLNSHFTMSMGMQEAAVLSAVLRLRRSTLTDLQVWLASQHMRQGLINVLP